MMPIDRLNEHYGLNLYCLKPIKRIAIFCLLLFPAAISITSDAVENQIGSITRARGTTSIRRPGVATEHPAAKGAAVYIGDELRTGKDSGSQITFSDGAFANLFEQSGLRVSQYSFDPASNRRTARVRLLNGRARFVLFNLRSDDSMLAVDTDTASITAYTIADFHVSASSSATEVVSLGQAVSVKNKSSFIVGQIWLNMNMKTVVLEKKSPASPVILSLEERKGYARDIGFDKRERKP